jgi:hypothetical protein
MQRLKEESANKINDLRSAASGCNMVHELQ